MKIIFNIEYHTTWGENLYMIGCERRIPMHYVDDGLWSATIEHCQASFLKDYYYQVVRDGVISRIEWRHHSRRMPKTDGCIFTDSWQDGPAYSNGFLRELSTPIFNIRGYRGAGTAIPVFSLRSGDDFGTGEFYDLRKMVDWAAETGQNIIQVLPINDTTMTGTWQDSYPYNACSTFALHPQYINLPAAGVKVDAAYRKLQAELNSLPSVDYARVNAEKTRLLRNLFAKKGAEVLAGKAYKTFLSANRHWLLPYAAFCALRDENGTADFTRWGEYAVYGERKVSAYIKSHEEAVGFYCFIQFHLDAQLKEVRGYAHSRGVSLKGDLPIGISRTSVDAWCFPKLFNMDSQAGAPPDAFARDGQNWGFPTYNWEEMAKDDYSWWKKRLGKMAEYFDAFRIDHILGFFRIWEIPVPEKSGLMGHFSPAQPYTMEEIAGRNLPAEGLFIQDPHKPGYWHPGISGRDSEAYAGLESWQKDSYDRLYEDFFYHKHNEYWKRQALRKLPALIGATGMMACGEDLGMIPACVPDVMSALKILSLEIQRMPKGFGETFGHTGSYPYLCVCTTSTHDMNPLRAWWEEDRELTQRYFNEVLHRDGEAPADCTPDICGQIIRDHLASPAMLVILPLQDWLGMDASLRHPDPASERINIPADPRNYWKYRMHLTLEDLLGSREFNSKVKGMISSSSRGEI